MRSKKTILILFLLLVTATVGGLLTISARRSAARAARFAREAQAVVTEINFNDYRTGRVSRERLDAVVDEKAGKRRRTTHIKYRYTVDGREIVNQSFERGDRRENYRVGEQIKICYDPRNPDESVLVEQDARCGAK